MRWWSGRDWTAYTMQSTGSFAKPTDGMAIASMVTSIVGLFPVGIGLGVAAKRRIRKAAGEREGGGFANAGIAIGGAYAAILAIVVALAVNGVFDEVNRDDYSGEQARVANVVDRFEEAYESGHAAELCSEIFTESLADAYASDGGCEVVWTDGTGYSEIDINELTITGDSATAIADDEDYAEGWAIDLTRGDDGEWRICGIE